MPKTFISVRLPLSSFTCAKEPGLARCSLPYLRDTTSSFQITPKDIKTEFNDMDGFGPGDLKTDVDDLDDLDSAPIPDDWNVLG